MARPKTTELMSIRLPIGTLAKLDKLAKEKFGKDNMRYRFVHDILVLASDTPIESKPPGPHEYPTPLKSHVQGEIVADKYGNAYELIGDSFVYKGMTK